VSIQFVLAQHGGIAPASRRRSLLTLALAGREDISRGIPYGLSLKLIASSGAKFWIVMAGDVNRAGAWRIFESITFSGGADRAMTLQKI
jgi:hypothetical protein